MLREGILELRSYCASESLSEEGLRQIIERHGLTPNHNNPHHDDLGNCQFFRTACSNERVNEGIIRCLLEYFPYAASAAGRGGWSPLHCACRKNVTPDIIQLLVDAAPATVRSQDSKGLMPLHCLCGNKEPDEIAAMEILKLLVEKHPEAIRHADNQGSLPIHRAPWGEKSPEFCRVLIEEYPGSERIVNHRGKLPLHNACECNSIATVEYLYSLYPDAVNHAVSDGKYPIHFAIVGVDHRGDPIAAVGIVKFLLDCDPNVKLQRLNGTTSLLRYACDGDYIDSNVDAGIQVIKMIYDAHPEAIEHNRFASNIHQYHQQLQTLINNELVYARQAKDHRLMTTPDGSGQLPLHKALQNNVRLGSIKLLVKGNPSAIRTFDKGGVTPLHVACQHHDSTNVIQYMVGLDETALRAVDFDSNTSLHYACSGAKYDTIAMLLKKYDAISVSKQNANGKLPIDLLWESNVVEDRESIEYTEGVFRLLKAYPEMVMNYNGNMKQPADTDANQNDKKRKFGHQG